MGPSQGRWGVLQALFPIPVMGKNDIARNFDVVLPLLKQHASGHASDVAVRQTICR
jgi:hypothetical protein